jgi:hypothetical protein
VFPELFLHSLYAAVLVIRQAFSIDRQDVQSVLELFDAICCSHMINATCPPAPMASYVMLCKLDPSFGLSACVGRCDLDTLLHLREPTRLTLWNAVSTFDFGTPASLAFASAADRRGLVSGSRELGGRRARYISCGNPLFSATVSAWPPDAGWLTLVILEKTIPRCESAAPFLCRILDHCFGVMSAQ